MTTITDKNLLAELKKSHLDKLHKDHFAILIPLMSDQERERLMQLIEESNKVNETRAEADAEYEKGLAKLNAEFDQKISATEKELTKYVRDEYRKFETEEAGGELEKIEAEIGKL